MQKRDKPFINPSSLTIWKFKSRLKTKSKAMRKIIIGAPGITGTTPELPEVAVIILKDRPCSKPIRKLTPSQKKRIQYVRKHGLK